MTITIRTLAVMTTLATRLASGQSAGLAPDHLAALLQPGMRLVYSSDGVESPPWTVDSVARDLTLGGRSGCVRLRLRTSPTQAAPETRQHCIEASTLVNWDERSGTGRPARPLGARALLEIAQANGGRVRYETGDPTVEHIVVERSSTAGVAAPTAIDVLPTTVTTLDSTGKIVRRLRERFSIALATATGGVFEVPDSTQSSGWRAVRSFELVAIRMP